MIDLRVIGIVIGIIGALAVVAVHMRKEYLLRRNVATALIKESQHHQHDLNGIRPHIDEKMFKERDFVTLDNGSQWEIYRYKPGYVPSPSRMSSQAYEGNSEKIMAFRNNTIQLLSDYYSGIYYTRDILGDIHEGNWMPPAAYNILEMRMGELREDSDDVIKKLEAEKRYFRRTRALILRYIDFRKR